VPGEVKRTALQESALTQVAALGQAPAAPAGIAVSQVSPASMVPLPQVAEQSGSSAFFAPVGQQPSPGIRCGLSV
jgi:hypothetical protein